MSHYTHVLVAIDGSEESPRIIEKALALAGGSADRVSVVQVFEVLTGSYGYKRQIEQLDSLQKAYCDDVSAETRAMLESRFPAIKAEDVHFARGKPAVEIKRLVGSMSVDLLVIGSHGQGAIESALLGSTANAVLHGSRCDVFVVRV